MKNVMKKVVATCLTATAIANSGYSAGQQLQSPAHDVRTAIVTQMQIAGSYVYLLVEERGEEVWLATSPEFVKDIKYGDIIEFFAEVEMQDFHSKGLDKTFKSLWFVSQIHVKQDVSQQGDDQEAAPRSPINQEISQ